MHRPQAASTDTNWIPKSVGGQLEIRQLPVADIVYSDYKEWVESSPEPKVRFYEISLAGSSNQINFKHKMDWQEGVVFGQTVTSGSFAYRSSHGDYFFTWNLPGKIPEKYFQLGDRPRRVLVWPMVNPDVAIPVLDIRAVEGVESKHVEVAVP